MTNASHASPRRAYLARVSLLVVSGLALLALVPSAATAATSTSASAALARQPEQGMVFDGLTPARADGPCKGRGFELAGAGGGCTHGPDPAPAGVDVRAHRSTSSIQVAAAEVAAGVAGSASGSVVCIGDGVSGNRVQAIYAHASGVADRYASIVGSIRTWAASMDADFNNSAAQTGGSRHIRFVTDGACQLSVLDVTLPATGDDDIYQTRSSLQALGYNRIDRKYAVWMDANVYCGIGFIEADDSAGATNRNNGNAAVAGLVSRTDAQCWGLVESHELMHNLGGVQLSAPHSSGLWHCTDEYDRMCYPDGTTKAMTYPCASDQNALFDCGKDDYFNTNPAAGSYLATHWNTANSSFLDASGAPPPPPPTSFALTATRAGTGTGTVTSSPAGINCGADCSETYATNTLVTLTAVPAVGSTLTGWTGGCVGTGTCVIAMSAAKTATATFASTAPPPPTASITVGDASVTPKALASAQAIRVTWANAGLLAHRLQDTSGLGLYDSGSMSPGASFGYTFVAAGIYNYADPAAPLLKGSIQVPMKLTPSSGGVATAFTVRWSSMPTFSPWTYDVQIKRPGSTAWVGYRTGVTYAYSTFVPDGGPGTYRFRARLRNATTGPATLYSPVGSLSVS